MEEPVRVEKQQKGEEIQEIHILCGKVTAGGVASLSEQKHSPTTIDGQTRILPGTLIPQSLTRNSDSHPVKAAGRVMQLV